MNSSLCLFSAVFLWVEVIKKTRNSNVIILDFYMIWIVGKIVFGFFFCKKTRGILFKHVLSHFVNFKCVQSVMIIQNCPEFLIQCIIIQ